MSTTVDERGGRTANFATWLGLVVALGGPSLAVAAKQAGYFGHADEATILNWFALWGAALLTMLVLVVLERQPLAAMGFGRFTWVSLAFGIGLGVVVIMMFPLSMQILKAANIPYPQSNLTAFATTPLWLRLGTWLTAGFAEEILFRGYPISRLKAATGSTAIAAIIPFAVFVVLHAPSWGVAHLLFVSMAAIAFTLAFLWRGDLWTNIVGHLAVDAVPLIILPLTSAPQG
jgi:membrane protease YdiL (CAAX protease family)